MSMMEYQLKKDIKVAVLWELSVNVVTILDKHFNDEMNSSYVTSLLNLVGINKMSVSYLCLIGGQTERNRLCHELINAH